MNVFSALLKPASGRCNMNCAYCFYHDVMSCREQGDRGLMSHETAEAFMVWAAAPLKRGDRMNIAFQGGEPTLAGLAFYRFFFSRMKELIPPGVRVDYALQTNGLLLDEAWCGLLKEHRVLVGLSIDGERACHDRNRRGLDGRGTYQRVMAAKGLLDRYGVDCNVLTTLTGESARSPKRMWDFLLREKIEYVQFMPCLAPLQGTGEDPLSLRPERYYTFYRGLFRYWAGAVRSGRYISVKLFDDLANRFLRGVSTVCGMGGNCSLQHVVEADGSVYPCDFYVLDQYRLGAVQTCGQKEICEAGARFLEQGRKERSWSICRRCPYASACGGGCRRMSPQVYFAGGVCWHRRLLDDILQELLQLSRALLQMKTPW